VDDPAPPLLQTKLRAPVPRRGVVARPRLAARIAGPESPPLTVVCAAAGFGKTTLVAECLGADPATAWLSLDPRDDDPQAFWTYVVAAVEAVRPGAGAGARSVLESSRPSSDAVVASLLNDLDAAGADLVLVLDDYHAIASREIHDAVAFMVERLPPRVRLVLTCRADPPLPLASLRARGALAEVRAADLRFAPDEAAAYLNGSMGLDLSAEDVAALEARTEGWIAALQLAALSMRGRDDAAGFIAGFAGDDRFVLDYLVGEVLERQPQEVRDFLLRTSILSRLTGPLCDAVTGGAGGAATLAELERANLFVVPLDDRRVWYRYHHLFADVLHALLLDERPGEVAGLHLRASAWAEDEGDLPEAVRHAMAGGDPERAAGLVERAAPAMRRARQEATLRRWIEALPDAVVTDRPALTLDLIGALMAGGDFDRVPRLLDEVERRGVQPAQTAIYRAALALVSGDPAGTLAHAGRALASVGPDDHLRRGAAAALAGLAHWSAGDLEAARERYAEAIVSLERAGHVSDALGCSLALADIEVGRGRLDAAMRALEAGLALAAPHGAVRGGADMHVAIADVLLERGDIDGAAGRLAAAETLGEHAGLPQNAYRSRVAAARLRELRGDADGALALLEEAGRRFDNDFSPVVRPLPAVVARLRLRMGDEAAALRWAGERGIGADDALAFATQFEHATLARILLRRGDPAAGPLVDRLLAAAREGGREGGVVELLVLRAIAERGRGDAPAALATLEEALLRAEPEGWVRAFLDEGAPVVELLRTAAGGGPAREQARRVLAHDAPRAPSAGDASAPGLAEDLSDREREVLRLLRSDLSGPDIARELVVSLNTVRTHTKHIYAKLGVNSRRAAVRRAAELGL
jgi:LuxR family maltose regulon positive regulatory protein